MPAPRVFYFYPVKPRPDLMATSKIPDHFKTEKPVAIFGETVKLGRWRSLITIEGVK